jgi:hypothetical protein
VRAVGSGWLRWWWHRGGGIAVVVATLALAGGGTAAAQDQPVPVQAIPVLDLERYTGPLA